MPDPVSVGDARQTLIDTARGFYEKNWMLGTAGNLSIKLSPPGSEAASLRYVITASGFDKGALTREDFVIAGAGGELLEATANKGSAEMLLHEAIYRRFPTVSAVYHVHTVAATLLSMHMPAGEHNLRFTGLEMMKGLGFDTHETTIHLPVVDNTQDIEGLSSTVVDHLDKSVPGLLLKGHGFYAWGKSPFEAKRHIEIWQFLLEYKLQEQILLGSLRSEAPLPDHKWPSSLPGF